MIFFQRHFSARHAAPRLLFVLYYSIYAPADDTAYAIAAPRFSLFITFATLFSLMPLFLPRKALLMRGTLQR
jgi:hypothetical protein